MTSLPLSELDLLHITHARHLLILTASVTKRSSIKRKIEKRGRRRERKRDPALMTAYESVSGHNLITSETDWTLQSTASTFDLCLCLFQKPTHPFIKHHFKSEDLLLKMFMKCNMARGLRHTNTTHIRASRLTLLSQWEAGRESVYLGLWDYQWANYLWSSRGSQADCARLPGMEDSLSRAWEIWEKWGTNDCTLFWCNECSLFLTAHYWYFFLIWGPSSFPLESQCECVLFESGGSCWKRQRALLPGGFVSLPALHCSARRTFPPAAPMTLQTCLLHRYGLYYFLALLALLMSQGRCVCVWIESVTEENKTK